MHQWKGILEYNIPIQRSFEIQILKVVKYGFRKIHNNSDIGEKADALNSTWIAINE